MTITTMMASFQISTKVRTSQVHVYSVFDISFKSDEKPA